MSVLPEYGWLGSNLKSTGMRPQPCRNRVGYTRGVQKPSTRWNVPKVSAIDVHKVGTREVCIKSEQG